jgi:hypothetical protein
MNHIKLAGLDHPVLGRLEPHETLSGVLATFTKLGDVQLAIWVDPDGGPLDDALRLAASAMPALAELDARCRMLISADLLPTYNTGWRFGRAAGADGEMVEFERPLLTEAEFSAKLSPTSFQVTGGSLIEFWYSDGEMFWGHSVGLTSFDGLALTDVYVEMFG